MGSEYDFSKGVRGVTADAFAAVAIWRVSRPLSPFRHGFKYRLAYVVASQCVLRYDNERGKGDHRHVGTVEAPYVFSTPDQLMADFNADFEVVPMAGLEPARLAPRPPQDGVSTNSTSSAHCKGVA
jgi:hypothetical protein